MSATFEPLGPWGEDGVLVVTPDLHGDARGFFLERYKASTYAAHGVGPFVQDNHSRSAGGVLRGLHWQAPPAAQGKLVGVLAGRILDVAVDVRRTSPHFGRWVSAVLDDHAHRHLWIPEGFAHGFLVLSDVADVHYKTTAEYAPALERSLRWDDPDVGVAWGTDAPTLSVKDAAAPHLRDYGDADPFTSADPFARTDPSSAASSTPTPHAPPNDDGRDRP